MPDAYLPLTVNGQTRLVSIPVDDRGKEMARRAEEMARRVEVAKRRLYYAGEQYAQENADAMTALHLDALRERLPEHRRKHAYSTQIQESVDFLADRIGEGFDVIAQAPAVQDVIDGMVVATDLISAESEDGDVDFVTDDVLRESLVAGDTPVEVKWDPIEARAFLEFWEAETVDFVRDGTRKTRKVVRTEVVWRTDELGQQRQVRERHEYEMLLNPAFVMEACRRMWWDDEDSEDDPPREVEWLGIGRLPWALLRCDSKSLRANRGESLITLQAMETADRYNAVEQVAWLIARYNSHANVAVIGDGASLKMESDGRVSKDVADVLTFPGGTALEVLSLPTDPQMIEHQRRVLSDALHAAFGLVRIEPDTVNGLGAVSGYALEILNQKTEGTFRRIRRYWRKDWISLLNLVLDVTAWKRETALGLVDLQSGAVLPVADEAALLPVAEDAVVLSQWWLTDPQAVFPDRVIEIRMGSGYIVDDVKVRDDFVANLVSRRYALQVRGLDDGTIDEIEEQIKDAEPEVPETSAFGSLPVVQPGGAGTSGTAAGSTVAGDTGRG